MHACTLDSDKRSAERHEIFRAEKMLSDRKYAQDRIDRIMKHIYLGLCRFVHYSEITLRWSIEPKTYNIGITMQNICYKVRRRFSFCDSTFSPLKKHAIIQCSVDITTGWFLLAIYMYRLIPTLVEQWWFYCYTFTRSSVLPHWRNRFVHE